MAGRQLMRDDDGACPRCGARDARAEKVEDDWHVVCAQCGYVAQGFGNSDGAWELWNGTREGGGLIEGTEGDRKWVGR